jgi:hypothetical protein
MERQLLARDVNNTCRVEHVYNIWVSKSFGNIPIDKKTTLEYHKGKNRMSVNAQQVGV